MSHRCEEEKNPLLYSQPIVRCQTYVRCISANEGRKFSGYDSAFAEGGSKTHTFLVTCFIFLVCRRGLGVQGTHVVPISEGAGPPSPLMADSCRVEAAALVTEDTLHAATPPELIPTHGGGIATTCRQAPPPSSPGARRGRWSGCLFNIGLK